MQFSKRSNSIRLLNGTRINSSILRLKSDVLKKIKINNKLLFLNQSHLGMTQNNNSDNNNNKNTNHCSFCFYCCCSNFFTFVFLLAFYFSGSARNINKKKKKKKKKTLLATVSREDCGKTTNKHYNYR